VVLSWPFDQAAATHSVAHCRPPAADSAFAPDFPVLQDSEWGYRLGGWGGLGKGRPLEHRPVVFIHGNTRDAHDWDEPGRSVRQRFLDAGYSGQELWAVSYNGRSTKHRAPLAQCGTAAQANVQDLAAFVGAVADYTGAAKLDIVAHSLGVVLARKMMAEQPRLAGLIDRFVAIAGPNHGTTVCRRTWLLWVVGWRDFIGCDEIKPGSAWLHSLNRLHGGTEAPGPTKYLTIYDGTGADILYLPWLFWLPVRDQDSPALDGAKNQRLPGLTHDGLRLDPMAVSLTLEFLQER
jgi:triacylglycerol lipase